jgi:hypothetical protein
MENICVVCGNEYNVYQKSRQKYCSTNCRVKGNRDKNKQKFNFLEKEYEKPKIETSVVRTENPDWTVLNQRLKKHQVQKGILLSSRTENNKKLISLTSKNKEKIIGSLIGLGFGVIGGYVLSVALKTGKKGKNSPIQNIVVNVPIGVLIGSLGLLGGLLGYGVSTVIASVDKLRNRKALNTIVELNEKINQIDGQIRLEEMNIEEISTQMTFVIEYSSITEIKKKKSDEQTGNVA